MKKFVGLEHKNVLNMVNSKILEIDRNVVNLQYSNDKKNVLLDIKNILESNPDNFFIDFGIDSSIKFLKDIGVEENKIFSVYKSLVDEEMNNKYILVDESLLRK